MIYKRYGSTLHSVDPNFDSRAMNEIGFQRSNQRSLTAEEFERDYQHVKTHELTAKAHGRVQTEAEQAVLAALLSQLQEIRQSHPDAVFLVESESGKDYPKLREQVVNIIVEGENKLEFHRHIDPPLRIAVYMARQS